MELRLALEREEQLLHVSNKSMEWERKEASSAWKVCRAVEEEEQVSMRAQIEHLLERWPSTYFSTLRVLSSNQEEDLEGCTNQDGQTNVMKRGKKGTLLRERELPSVDGELESSRTIAMEGSTSTSLLLLRSDPKDRKDMEESSLFGWQRSRSGARVLPSSYTCGPTNLAGDPRNHLQDCIESALHLHHESEAASDRERHECTDDLESRVEQASARAAACMEEALMHFLGVDLHHAYPALTRNKIIHAADSGGSSKRTRKQKRSVAGPEGLLLQERVHACHGKIPTGTLDALGISKNSTSAEQHVFHSTGAWEAVTRKFPNPTRPAESSSPSELALPREEKDLKDACLRVGIHEEAFVRAKRRLSRLYLDA